MERTPFFLSSEADALLPGKGGVMDLAFAGPTVGRPLYLTP